MKLRRRQCIAYGLAAVGLSGCESLGWLGDPEEPQLPGKRIPVMLIDEGVEADPRLAQLQVVLPPPRRNSDWTQTGGNAVHAMHHLALGENPTLAWRADIGSGSSEERKLLSQPVAAGGRVFTVDTSLEVRAFDLASGRLVWKSAPELVESVDRLSAGGLAIAGDRLFLTTTSGEVFGLAVADGSVLWHRPLLAPILAPPAVFGGLVFIVTADNRLLAMNTTDGAPVWQHAGLFEQAGILGGAPVATDGRTVVVAYSSGEVFALRFRDGRAIWSDSVLRPRRTLGLGAISDITGAPVIDGDRVYVVGNGGEMAAFALDRGSRFWDSDLTSRETPWIAGEFIYLLTDRNEIVCLLRRGGRVRWVSPFARLVDPDDPTSRRIIWGAPVLAGDRLVVAGSTAEAVSVSPYTGEVLGRIRLPAPVRIAPVVVDATLLFLTESGDLLAYR